MGRMKMDYEAIVRQALEDYSKDRLRDGPDALPSDPDEFLYDFGIWLAAKHKEPKK